MKHRIEEKSDFETKARNDPIETLNRIQDYMYVPARAKYEYDILSESVERLLVGTKQQDGESLINYGKRFKQAKKMFTEATGNKILDDFVKRTKYYIEAADDASKEEVHEEAHEQWMSHIFMRNADQ